MQKFKKKKNSTPKSINFNMNLTKSLKKFQFGFNLPFFWTVFWFEYLSNDISNPLSPITLKPKAPSPSNFRSKSPEAFVNSGNVEFKLYAILWNHKNGFFWNDLLKVGKVTKNKDIAATNATDKDVNKSASAQKLNVSLKSKDDSTPPATVPPITALYVLFLNATLFIINSELLNYFYL